jgi:hypothetical protein
VAIGQKVSRDKMDCAAISPPIRCSAISIREISCSLETPHV